MSSEDPDPRRPRPISLGGGFTFVYAALAVVFAATAVYFLTMRHAPLMSPQVGVSALGALWFGVRMAMSMGKRG